MKKIIVCIVFIVLLFSCSSDSEKFYKTLEYNGLIIDTFRQFNHNTLVFRINVNESIEVEDELVWGGIGEYAEIGDSIIKPKDTLILIVKKSEKNLKPFQAKQKVFKYTW